MNTCHTCDQLNCEVRESTQTNRQALTQLDIHQRNSKDARELLKEDMIHF